MEEPLLQPRVFSVTDLTRKIKSVLEGGREFTNVWVKGEIYNLTLHSSGHIYFTLKDDNAVISAVFFKYANKNLTFKLKEGMSVLALGSITVFEKRGSYQINVSMVKPDGIGDLQQRIELLKKKLLAEGIFDPLRKRPLPLLPRRLGVVTSPTGAAVRDIIKVALRRYPNIEIVVAPAKVQGDDAPITIVRGIEELNRPEYAIDVIIAGRGGGSFEDLMPFNEEAVIRAFFNSRVPIISAVGHQIDHPLSDDAADLTAPTPSAAAELAVPLKKELVDEIEYLKIRAFNSLSGQVAHFKTRLDGVLSRRVFRDPFEIITSREMSLSDVENRMISLIKDRLAAGRNRLFAIPDIKMLVKSAFNAKSHRFNLAVKALDQLSPLSILSRGYAIALDQHNDVVKSVNDVSAGSLVDLVLKDGRLACTVSAKHKGAYHGEEKIVKD